MLITVKIQTFFQKLLILFFILFNNVKTEMDTEQAYNIWADTYDRDQNKTRDLELFAFKNTLFDFSFDSVIEIGCGTGKNTLLLSERSKHLKALDFSGKMLSKAKVKIDSEDVDFLKADITKPWQLSNNSAELVSCSLVLEHIENIDFIFWEVSKKLVSGGMFYLCELHPYRQYLGKKAHFSLESRLYEPEVFIHHLSDYYNAAEKNNLQVSQIREWFDENNTKGIPRLISFIFDKPKQNDKS